MKVIDAAMTDGAASLMTLFYGMLGAGQWQDQPGANVLDTGAHFYEVYETSDGKYVSIASIEAKFYAILVDKLGLNLADLPPQMDRSTWPDMLSTARATWVCGGRSSRAHSGSRPRASPASGGPACSSAARSAG